MNTETTTNALPKTDAHQIALIAKRRHFSTWHGFGEGADGSFYLFSNAPTPDRARILAEVTEHMKARGCELTSSGSYAETGEDVSYTVALVFSRSPHGADLEALRILYQAAAIRMFPAQCGYPNGTVHHVPARELAATTDN